MLGTYITTLNTCHNFGIELANSIALTLFSLTNFTVVFTIGIIYECLFLLCFYKRITKLSLTNKDNWKLQFKGLLFPN